MGKELESVDQSADLAPMYGPGTLPGAYAQNDTYLDNAPGWMDPVPPFGYSDGWKDKIDRYWSYIIRWPRFLAAGFLWVSFSVWRFLYVVGTVTMILILLFNR